MPGKVATDGSNSKWTRMLISSDFAHLNVRREQLAHLVHYKKNIAFIKELSAKLGRPLTILDVGCGEANTLRMLYSADTSKKAEIVRTYIGIDGDPGVVERTSEAAKTPLKGVGGRLEVCDITKGVFPVEPRSVDLIINNEVLEHIPAEAVPKVLRAMRRSLAVGGRALISTPNKDGTRDKLPADHVYEWRLQELHDAFKAAGLKCEQCIGVYIQKNNLMRYLREHNPDMVPFAEERWDLYGNDVGSIMTAHMAVRVANNVIHVVRKMTKTEREGYLGDGVF